jgi:hypothetical protein
MLGISHPGSQALGLRCGQVQTPTSPAVTATAAASRRTSSTCGPTRPKPLRAYLASFCLLHPGCQRVMCSWATTSMVVVRCCSMARVRSMNIVRQPAESMIAEYSRQQASRRLSRLSWRELNAGPSRTPARTTHAFTRLRETWVGSFRTRPVASLPALCRATRRSSPFWPSSPSALFLTPSANPLVGHSLVRTMRLPKRSCRPLRSSIPCDRAICESERPIGTTGRRPVVAVD